MELRCGAYRADGRVCGELATTIDRQRGCLVCGEHLPRCAVCGSPTEIWCRRAGEYRCMAHLLVVEPVGPPTVREGGRDDDTAER